MYVNKLQLNLNMTEISTELLCIACICFWWQMVLLEHGVNIKLDQRVIKFVYVVHEVFSENTEQCEFSVFC